MRGLVRTLDPARPVAGGVVVRDGRIAALLDEEPPAAGGPCVVPGFCDAHVHFPSWAVSRLELDLRGADSLEDALELVARATDGHRGGWLRGRGWRDELWAQPASVAALDAVCGDALVALRAQDGHSLWCSSAALALAGGDLETPGGVVEPSGILREEAAWRFQARFTEPTLDEKLDAMREGFAVAAAAGVTAIHDMDGGRGAAEAFAALGADVPLRVWQSVPIERLDEVPEADFVKAFMDGTLGSRTARLLDGSGVSITSRAGLEAVVRRAADRGLPVAVHAIGDLANREALDAFEATAAVWRGLRPRIEHAQCVHPDDQARFASLGVTASVQYSHGVSDRDLAARLWAERLEWAYPYRALLDAGVRLAGGSDAPVEPLDPLAGLRAAVSLDVPLDAALSSFCEAPAWLSGDEARLGRLAVGYEADLVVLDRDPFVDLASCSVVATMVRGSWTSRAPA